MSKELIDELGDTFDYHEGGYLIRKRTGKPCGQRANNGKGYARVWVNGRYLYAHRIIYAIIHGEMPEGEIDHINGNRIDNRIENLREVSTVENMHNSKIYKTNKSGFTGVYWDTQRQKWQAYIMVDNRQINLGRFENFEDAVEARKMAKMEYHSSSPEALKYVSEGIELKCEERRYDRYLGC